MVDDETVELAAWLGKLETLKYFHEHGEGVGPHTGTGIVANDSEGAKNVVVWGPMK